jgi:hypothetical protein
MDPARVDLVLEYALLAAGRADDYFDRFLGPIHLIKYVYLADLACAEKHGGQTYTGVPWRFHNFGPWSPEVFTRIEPATKRLSASERAFPSQYADDRVMWSITDEDAFEAVDRKLPLDVALRVKRYVHKFGHDTSALLHFVYNTPPMARAAPGETLDFGTVMQIADPNESPPYARAELTDKQKKRRAERIKQAREVLLTKLRAPPRPRAAPPVPAPRYDEVFEECVAWLDSLAGDSLQPSTREMLVDSSVWKSPLRADRHDE